MAVEDRPLARHIVDCFPTLTERLALEEQIKSFMEHPGYEAVVRLLDAEIGMLSRSMDGARVLDQAEYARLHGRSGGLRGLELGAETLLARAEAERHEQERDAEHADAALTAGR